MACWLQKIVYAMFYYDWLCSTQISYAIFNRQQKDELSSVPPKAAYWSHFLIDGVTATCPVCGCRNPLVRGEYCYKIYEIFLQTIWKIWTLRYTVYGIICQNLSNLSRQMFYNCLDKRSSIVREHLDCLDEFTWMDNLDKFRQSLPENIV